MTVDIRQLMKHLPHRYPFLLVDRVVECDSEKLSLVAIKNVTINEPFFMGHFPDHPVMPGVLILEALAQAAGVLILEADPAMTAQEYLFLLVGFDDVRFKRMVIPGDQLHLHVELLRQKQDIYKFQVTATVDGEVACSAQLMTARRRKSDDR